MMKKKMCSNSDSNSTRGIGSEGGTMWKKQQQQQQQKRTRVPKRGPGVAELEKILREQQTIDTTTSSTTTNVETSSSSCFMNHYNHSSSSSSMKSHHHHQGSMPSSHHGPPRFDQLGRSIGQEHELFPMNMNLTSSKSKSNLNEVMIGMMDHGNQLDSGESNHLWSNYPPTIQKRNNQYPHPPPLPPMMQMNQFLGSSSQVASGSLSNGLYSTHQEPPSNQSSFYHYTSRLPEEHKMAGMKRVHTSSIDNSLIPPSNFQVLPSFSRYNRPHQSSPNDNHAIATFNSTNEIHRDPKWGSSLELSSRRFNSDIVGASHANFSPFSSPEVIPPPPLHLFQGVHSKGNVIPYQVTEAKMEESYQRSESSGPNPKPFYNFLEVKDQEELTDSTQGSNHGGREAGRGGIDLSLKL